MLLHFTREEDWWHVKENSLFIMLHIIDHRVSDLSTLLHSWTVRSLAMFVNRKTSKALFTDSWLVQFVVDGCEESWWHKRQEWKWELNEQWNHICNIVFQWVPFMLNPFSIQDLSSSCLVRIECNPTLQQQTVPKRKQSNQCIIFFLQLFVKSMYCLQNEYFRIFYLNYLWKKLGKLLIDHELEQHKLSARIH